MHVRIPQLDGLGVMEPILRLNPKPMVLILATFGEENYIDWA